MNGLVGQSARLIDGATGRELDDESLHALVDDRAVELARMGVGTVFLRFPTTVEGVLNYLAAWTSMQPVVLLDPALSPEIVADLVERYHPALVLGVDAAPALPTPLDGYVHDTSAGLGELWRRTEAPAPRPHPELAILLATSGSTGNPKLVRLSRDAILANTSAIIDALAITPEDVALTSLPLFYSFGMSVLNTHLAAGATVVVAEGDLMSRTFWDVVDQYAVTSLALVPTQYEMLRRLRFDPSAHPSLRTLTQAGGRMRTELVSQIAQRMAEVDGRLVVMYGMTEAGPRLTVLPPDRVSEKPGSVGRAVPGGRLSIRGEDGGELAAPGAVGEVVYHGPNVMMGYAECAADLARGDDLDGVLRTGDLGSLDDEGFLTLAGRRSRFAKVFGVRVNLDDVEHLFAPAAPVAATSGDDRVVVHFESEPAGGIDALVHEVADGLRLHWSGIDARPVTTLPLLPSGKVDYRALGAP